MLLTDLGVPVREWRSSGAGVPEPCQIRRAGLPEQPEGEDEEAQAHHTQNNHTRNQRTGDRIQRLGRAAHCRATDRGERGEGDNVGFVGLGGGTGVKK